MTENGGAYIDTDEVDDLCGGLEFVADLFEKPERSATEWKVIIFLLHCAVTSAMVIRLSGSAKVGALTKKSAGEGLQSGMLKPLPKEELAKFHELVKRTQNNDRMREYGAKAIVLSTEDKERLKKLNELRNSFTHFLPRIWLVYLDGMPDIANTATDFISSLLFDRAWYGLMPDDRPRLETALDRISRALSRLGALSRP